MLSHQDRALVTNVRIQDSFQLDSGALLKVRTVTYNVGTQGPFTYSVPWAEFTPEKLNAEWAREIDGLRQLGVLA